MATRKNKHAVALGRIGGKATSPRKTETARENGKRGGRPPVKKKTPKPKPSAPRPRPPSATFLDEV